MRKVIKHQVIGLTALIILVVFLSGMVSASGTLGSRSTKVQPLTTAPAGAKLSAKPLAAPSAKTPAAPAAPKTETLTVSKPAAANSKPIVASAKVATASAPDSTAAYSGGAVVLVLVQEDTNGDGNADSQMDGVTVNLYDGSMNLLGSKATGADQVFGGWKHGCASWDKLSWETHVVEVVPPADYCLVKPASGTITLTSGCFRQGNFILTRKGTLKVYKFNDVNENGVRDPGEAGMSDVKIIVDDGAQSGVTGGDGSVSFNVKPGNHTVTVDESTAPGYYPTGPITKTVDVPCGGEATVYFGNAQYGSISGHKWNDTDRSGDHQQGEPPVSGVTIKLTGTTDVGHKAVNLTTTTGADGSYSFTGLQAGTYTVSEVVPADMTNTSPTSLDVTLTPGQNVTDKDFNNVYTKGKIDGYKFKDMNENGVKDGGEVGIPGVRITLDGNVDDAVTDSNGYFSFIVDPGTHTVAVDESTVTGYYPTTDTSATKDVPMGGVESVNFGNAPYGSISGHKWNDKNKNKKHDTGDVAVAGMTVKLSGTTSFDDKTVSLSTTTGADGSYSFTGLQAGSYTVSEVMPAGMQAVSDESVDVTLTVGEVVTDIDFFNAEKTTTPQPPSNPSTPTTPTTTTTPTTPASTAQPTTAQTTKASTTSSTTLPYTGMNQAPISLSAWFATGLGLLLLGAGIVRRRRQLDWFTKWAAAVPGRKWK